MRPPAGAGDDAVTAKRLPPRCLFGVRAHVHLRPFQCRSKALYEPSGADPTDERTFQSLTATRGQSPE
jgi:hypothetical protein